MLPYKEKAARISHGNSRLGCKGETGNLISPPQSLYLSRKGFVSTEWQRKTDWKDTFWNIFDGTLCCSVVIYSETPCPWAWPTFVSSSFPNWTSSTKPTPKYHWPSAFFLCFPSCLVILLLFQVISYILFLDPVQRHLKIAPAKVLSQECSSFHFDEFHVTSYWLLHAVHVSWPPFVGAFIAVTKPREGRHGSLEFPAQPIAELCIWWADRKWWWAVAIINAPLYLKD